MRDEVGSINWNEIVTGNKVISDWSKWKLFFEKMRDKSIPFKNSKIKHNKWITRAVKKGKRAKNKDWIKFKKFEMYKWQLGQ